MHKLILLGCVVLFSLAQAKMVDGIAMIVNGEAVTTSEIRAVQQQLGVSKKQAVDMLVQDRLQKSAMKKTKIPETDVDNKIAQIAAQNNLTIPKMQKLLKAQGTSWSKYRKSVKESLKKQKFYREKVAATVIKPSEDELKLFYENNKKDFVIPTSISMVEYSAASEDTLKKFLSTRQKTRGVKSRSVKKSTSNLNSALLGQLLQTQNGSFTRPFNAGDRFISYKVVSKNGQKSMSYEDAKGAVAGKWRQQQQGKALKDYFEKMKTNADIRIIR
jgi:parvulin-like peptidyl-prolyl isomerase